MYIYFKIGVMQALNPCLIPRKYKEATILKETDNFEIVHA